MKPFVFGLPRVAWIALLAVICVAIYLPSLHGGFLFDDIPTLLQNPALRAADSESRSWLAIALSTNTGMLRRPISMLSFGANVALFGMSPFAFKAVNLAIHLLNGLLVFALARILAAQWLGSGYDLNRRASEIALFAASAWLLHPLNLSDVAYVVQRMNALSALFTLAGLLCYSQARTHAPEGERNLAQGLLGLCLFGVLAVFCKENGALIFAYAFVIEWLAFGFKAPETERRIIRGFFWLVLGAPLAFAALFLATHPDWLINSYSARDFTLVERILTEARVIWHYVLWIIVPNPAWMGIYHDDITVSTSLLSPPTSLVSVIALLGVAASAFTLRKRHPAYTFSVAWFLVGHSMESTVLPLEIVFEHRNYLPMAGLLIGVACLAANWARKPNHLRVVAVAGALFVGICAVLTAVRARDWADPLHLALADVDHHPDSARCQYEAGRAIIINGEQHGHREAANAEALPYFDRATVLDPNDLHGLIESLVIRAGKAPANPAQISELRTRLARTTTYTRANPFLDFLVTASSGGLAISPTDIASLVEAAMANSHLPPKVRAMVLNNYGGYQFNVAHDHQAAISLTLAASSEEPTNPYFPLNLSKIAIAIGDREKAIEYLAKASELDAAQVHANGIAQARSQIDAMGKPATP